MHPKPPSPPTDAIPIAPINRPPIAVERIAVETAAAETTLVKPIPGWVASAFVHAMLLVAIAMIQMPESRHRIAQIIRLAPKANLEDTPLEEIDFRKLDVSEEETGTELGEDLGVELNLPLVPTIPDTPTLEMPIESPPVVTGFESQQSLQLATGKDFYKRIKTKGLAGVGTDSTSVAIDRLTREILLSLEERPTLVVWLMDQSASVIPQRQEIHRRFDRIYREIGAVQASGTFGKQADKPLLSSVVAFGRGATLRLDKPTDDVDQLKSAVAEIPRDDSGVESVFQAITMAVGEFRKFRRIDSDTGQPLRNVMFVVFSDEAGDDQEHLEKAITSSQAVEIPVFVVGVPAPFGQPETRVKWIDPDPNYDQTPGWGLVSQGPESVLAERIRLGNATDPERETPIDSGFGPYALTRLCYETGGIYFAVHADRARKRRTRAGQVRPFSAHVAKFFDQETMRRYRPDYVSLADYRDLLNDNACRAALVQAARESWIAEMEMPQVRFVVRNESQFAGELTESQKVAAVLEPRLAALHAILKQGESDRPNEQSPRWQAGYDLAMGRTLATLARTRTFNAMLAQAKRGLRTTDPKHNTWTITPSDKIEISSELKRISEKATRYLQSVVTEHPGTPWAHLAAKELRKPIGWKWTDSFTMTREQIAQMRQSNNNRMPRDQQVRSINRKPKRKIPRL